MKAKQFKKFLASCLLVLSPLAVTSCGDEPEPVVERTVDEVRADAKDSLKELASSLDRNAYSDSDLAIFDQIMAYGNTFVENASSIDGINDAVSTVQKQWNDLIAKSRKLGLIH